MKCSKSKLRNKGEDTGHEGTTTIFWNAKITILFKTSLVYSMCLRFDLVRRFLSYPNALTH